MARTTLHAGYWAGAQLEAVRIVFGDQKGIKEYIMQRQNTYNLASNQIQSE